VADDLGADFDQLLAQAGQRPRLRRLRHRQRPHEIAEIVGQRVELEADGFGGEGATRQAGPLDRALAFFDVLLAGAAVVVEGNDALGFGEFVISREAVTELRSLRRELREICEQGNSHDVESAKVTRHCLVQIREIDKDDLRRGVGSAIRRARRILVGRRPATKI
jgi:hypothetical protein